MRRKPLNNFSLFTISHSSFPFNARKNSERKEERWRKKSDIEKEESMLEFDSGG